MVHRGCHFFCHQTSFIIITSRISTKTYKQHIYKKNFFLVNIIQLYIAHINSVNFNEYFSHDQHVGKSYAFLNFLCNWQHNYKKDIRRVFRQCGFEYVPPYDFSFHKFSGKKDMQILLDLFLLGRLEHSVEDSVITNKSKVLHVLFNNNFGYYIVIIIIQYNYYIFIIF